MLFGNRVADQIFLDYWHFSILVQEHISSKWFCASQVYKKKKKKSWKESQATEM